MLTVITPTGARPEAFALCARMMARQTYKGRGLWIIVDDGEEPIRAAPPMPSNWSVELLHPTPRWSPGANTQGRNLLAGLDLAEGLALLSREELRLTIVEDDDWYSCNWIDTLAAEMDAAELVGEGFARYYNVAWRCHQRLKNADYASLRSTGMRGAALKTFRRVLQEPRRYYDRELWRLHESRRVFDAGLTVGLKGLPGRPGIGSGHRDMQVTTDRNLEILRAWIGQDADWYAPYLRQTNMDNKVTARVLRGFPYRNRRMIAGETIDLPLSIAQKLSRRNMVSIDAPPPPVVNAPPSQENNLNASATAARASGRRRPAEPATPAPAEASEPATQVETE